MKRALLPIVAFVTAVAACAGSDSRPDRSPESTLRSTGVGPVAFGSSLAEAEVMMGEKARGLGGDAGCGYVEFSSLPGLQFTIRDGVIARADAGVGVRNSLGVNLGDLVESVVYLYPDVRMLRVPNSFGETMLIFDDPGKAHAIVLQAAGNKIIGIRAGLNSAVGSGKGCP